MTPRRVKYALAGSKPGRVSIKTCNKCGITKAVGEYNKKTAGRLQSVCRPCQNKASAEHYKNNKEYYARKRDRVRDKYRKDYTDFKKSLFCSACGEDEASCLDFHHTDPSSKEYSVGTLVGRRTLEKLKLEMEKCVVLCSNCHRKLHAGIIELNAESSNGRTALSESDNKGSIPFSASITPENAQKVLDCISLLVQNKGNLLWTFSERLCYEEAVKLLKKLGAVLRYEK